jgi:hypothetical protein
MKDLKSKVRLSILLDLIAMLVIGIVGVVIASSAAAIIAGALELLITIDIIAAAKYLKKLK